MKGRCSSLSLSCCSANGRLRWVDCLFFFLSEAIEMADRDEDPAKMEEERLMRALSRQGKPAAGKPTIAKKVEPTAAPAKKEAAPAGTIPAWKKAQMEREEEDRKRREEEAKKKEEQAKVIEARVKEFGLGASQEDENIEKYLTSPRDAHVEKPKVETSKPAFDDPVESRAAAEKAQRDEELVRLHSLLKGFVCPSRPPILFGLALLPPFPALISSPLF